MKSSEVIAILGFSECVLACLGPQKELDVYVVADYSHPL